VATPVPDNKVEYEKNCFHHMEKLDEKGLLEDTPKCRRRRGRLYKPWQDHYWG
jgi:hypothetical protein